MAGKFRNIKKAFKRHSRSKRFVADLSSLWLVKRESVDALFSRDEEDLRGGVEAKGLHSSMNKVASSARMQLGKVKEDILREGERLYSSLERIDGEMNVGVLDNGVLDNEMLNNKLNSEMLNNKLNNKLNSEMLDSDSMLDYDKTNRRENSRLAERERKKETARIGIEMACSGPEMVFYVILAAAEYVVGVFCRWVRAWWLVAVVAIVWQVVGAGF
ncbi:hypothetical protein HII13_000156 [Brettanomyces bruxellensis]|nr:hypothetical protein HII13_000156 [Brettanomyces bruxellensis]